MSDTDTTSMDGSTSSSSHGILLPYLDLDAGSSSDSDYEQPERVWEDLPLLDDISEEELEDLVAQEESSDEDEDLHEDAPLLDDDEPAMPALPPMPVNPPMPLQWAASGRCFGIDPVAPPDQVHDEAQALSRNPIADTTKLTYARANANFLLYCYLHDDTLLTEHALNFFQQGDCLFQNPPEVGIELPKPFLHQR